MVAGDDFPWAKPPKSWIDSAAVEHERASRQWTERGSAMDFRQWVRELHEAMGGDLIPLQWVPEFVGVTRAAVRQRVEASMLTVFRYVITELSVSVFGGVKDRETRRTYEYASVRECKAWREIVEARYDIDLSPKKRR
jgi:hypothetical protein